MIRIHLPWDGVGWQAIAPGLYAHPFVIQWLSFRKLAVWHAERSEACLITVWKLKSSDVIRACVLLLKTTELHWD